MPRDEAHFWVSGIAHASTLSRALASAEVPSLRDYNAFGAEVDFPVARAHGDAAAAVLERLGLEYYVTHRRIWGAAEMRRAPWHWMLIRRETRGISAPTPLDDLDLAQSCPKCLAGARARGRLNLESSSRFPGKLNVLMSDEVVVAGGVRARLREVGVRGVEYLPLTVRGAARSLKDVWHMRARETAAPADQRSDIMRESECGACRRDGWHSKPMSARLLAYTDRALERDVDILETHEVFGSTVRWTNGMVRPARPQFLVSGRLYRILRTELRIGGIQFHPLEFV